MTNIDL
jgi:hypothetical protein